jgi:predicted transcriptional regulator
MRKIKIKPELLSLLTSEAFQQFTTQALITAYQKLPTSFNLNQRQVQQFIFRNLERLESAGLATKEREGKNKHAEYRLTEKFTSSHYIVGEPHNKEGVAKVKQGSTVLIDPLKELREQLSNHKLELLTTIAETEEYEELCQKLPSKQLEIQELYNDARNRYSKTLGKVKAIESLIFRTER